MIKKTHTIDDEWAHFLDTGNQDAGYEEKESIGQVGVAPSPTNLYISTKSKIAFLNQDLDLKQMFWGVHVTPYSLPQEGVIKKQMKFNSLSREELETIHTHLQRESFVEEQIITSIDNPMGRIKFKDIRKVSVGMCKKDILCQRSKKKSAFYNCFVMILRIKLENIFKEFHIKVFNTGKMEIPGVQNDAMFEIILSTVLSILKPFVSDQAHPLLYLKKSNTILVNSNFNCGYYINREILYNLLKTKYNIPCIYDPCSYPGIQCKYICDEVEVSFMIFRTGSILIVGMCEDDVLYHIYEFLKKMLHEEYLVIYQQVVQEEKQVREKKKKVHRKNILVDNNIAAY